MTSALPRSPASGASPAAGGRCSRRRARTRQGDVLGDAQVADGDVGQAVLADVDEDGAGAAVLEGLEGAGEQGGLAELPGGALQVGDEVDLAVAELGRRRLEQAGDGLHGGRQVGVAVRQAELADLAGDALAVLGRLGDDDLAARPGHHDDAEGVAPGAVLGDLGGRLAGPVEGDGAVLLGGHAEGGVEDDDLVGALGAAGGGQDGLGEDLAPEGLGPGGDGAHGQDDEQDEQAADEQEEELLEAHAAGVLALGGEEEAHGRPVQDAEAAAVEQVDDDGHRHGAGGDGPRGQRELEDGQERHQREGHFAISKCSGLRDKETRRGGEKERKKPPRSGARRSATGIRRFGFLLLVSLSPCLLVTSE